MLSDARGWGGGVTTFYLVRHGETTGGPGDPGLAPSGVAQAEAVAAQLSVRPIAAVYSSPLRRARETAAAIAAAAGCDVEIDERLRERANWGDVEGQSWDDFVAAWQRSHANRDYVVPGGLSANEAGARAAAFVRDCHAHFPDEGSAVVAVAHGGIIVDLLLEFCDEAVLVDLKPDLWTRGLRWCSATELCYDGANATVDFLAHSRDG
jgi:broad specificity phosphatase PhoE